MRSKLESDDPEATQVVVTRHLDLSDESGDSDLAGQPVLSGSRRLKVVLYSVLMAVASASGLALLVSWAWYLPEGDLLKTLDDNLRQYALLNTLFTMMIAGAAGGALANLRELLRIGRHQEGLPVRLEVPFYLRPLSAGAMGVLVFFVVQSLVGLLSVGAATQAWALLHGRLAYVAVALLVGFCVRDLDTLREVAATLFAKRR